MADDAHRHAERGDGGPDRPDAIGDPSDAAHEGLGDAAASSAHDRHGVDEPVGGPPPASATDPALELMIDRAGQPAPPEVDPGRAAAADPPSTASTPSGAKYRPAEGPDLSELPERPPRQQPVPNQPGPNPGIDERPTVQIPRLGRSGLTYEPVDAGVAPISADVAPPPQIADEDQPDPPPPVAPQPAPAVSAMDASRALWREREPDDPSDPVEHLVAQRVAGNNGAWLAAASRRGRSHAHDAKYREDHYALRIESDWLLIAVGDGTGSRPLARVGSRIACQAAIEYLADGLKYSEGDTPIDERLRGSLAGAMVHALAHVADEAARRRRDIDDFATTLLLVAANITPEGAWVGIGQIGDGGIAAVLETGECRMLGKSDHGSFGGESAFLTSPEVQLTWPKRVFAYRVDQPFRMIAVGSDGVMDDFTEPFGKIELLFEQLDPIVATEAPEQALLDWMAYERRGSFDDRTLALLVPGQSFVGPSP